MSTEKVKTPHPKHPFLNKDINLPHITETRIYLCHHISGITKKYYIMCNRHKRSKSHLTRHPKTPSLSCRNDFYSKDLTKSLTLVRVPVGPNRSSPWPSNHYYDGSIMRSVPTSDIDESIESPLRRSDKETTSHIRVPADRPNSDYGGHNPGDPLNRPIVISRRLRTEGNPG